MIRRCLLVLLACVPALLAEPVRVWKPLFTDGQLQQWTSNGVGSWSTIPGGVRGMLEASEKRHGLLYSTASYTDFILRGEFKIQSGDSGLYFRAKILQTKIGIAGTQAEIDLSEQVGGLYETGGRKWFAEPKPELVRQFVKNQDWNQILITAIGGSITVSINGRTFVSVPRDEGRREGVFALQLHGGQDMDVSFRKFELLDLAQTGGKDY